MNTDPDSRQIRAEYDQRVRGKTELTVMGKMIDGFHRNETNRQKSITIFRKKNPDQVGNFWVIQ